MNGWQYILELRDADVLMLYRVSDAMIGEYGEMCAVLDADSVRDSVGVCEWGGCDINGDQHAFFICKWLISRRRNASINNPVLSP